MAWRQSPGGSQQHLTRAAAAARTRTQRPGKHLAVHAPELVVKPDFQILRRYRRPLLLRLEHTHRPTLEGYVHRATRLGRSRSLNLRIGIRPDDVIVVRIGAGFKKPTVAYVELFQTRLIYLYSYVKRQMCKCSCRVCEPTLYVGLRRSCNRPRKTLRRCADLCVEGRTYVRIRRRAASKSFIC